MKEKIRVCAFLSQLGELLVENAWQIEETAGQVGDLVSTGGRADRTTILTMQRFDRLRQEFEAIGKVLQCFAQNLESEASDALPDLITSAISTIAVENLRERLLRGLEESLPLPDAASTLPVDPAEIDVDVVF